MITIFKNSILYTLLLIALALNSSAQQNSIKFTKISLENGLSQSTVNAIIQDRTGFMWFATIDGLNKYDGYSIKIFRHRPDDPNSVVSNAINTIYEDSEGLLWIGTQNNGVCVYNSLQNKFYAVSYMNDRDQQPGFENVITIYEDKQKNFWIGTANGLIKFNRKLRTTHTYRNIAGDDKSIAGNYISRIEEDEEGNIWIATNKGLSILNTSSGMFTSFTQQNSGISSNKITSFARQDKNTIWLGTDNGLNKLSLQNNNGNLSASARFYTTKANNPKALNDNAITTLFLDQTKLLWIGTEKGGLNKFDISTDEFTSYTHDPTFNFSLSVNHVLSLFQDRTGVLWVGTSLGGINKWNRTVEGLDIFRHNPYDSNSLSTSQVRSVYQDKSGDFWIGTVDGGLNRWNTETNTFTRFLHNPFDAGSISHNHVRTILEDSFGNFWVGTDGGGLNLFDRKTLKFKVFKSNPNVPGSLSNDRIFRVYEDKQKNLWVATYGGGLNLYNRKENTFTAFKNSSADPNSLSNDMVTSIIQDRDGIYWIGTFGGGINKWDGKSNKFEAFKSLDNDTNSLGDNRVYSVFEDSEGILWMGTKGGGLTRFDRKINLFTRINEDDGLPNDVVMGILEDNEGFLWMSTNNGLCKLNRKTLKVRNYDVKDGLQSNEFLVGSFHKANDGKLLFGGINGFNAFYPEKIKDNPHIPEIIITGFQIFNKEVALDTTIVAKKIIELKHYENFISFDFVALNYIFPEKNQYKYILEGYDKDWNLVKDRRFANYTSLPPATYVFRVKGSNNDGVWNDIGRSIVVVIHPAWYQTQTFRISAVLAILLLIYLLVRMRIRRIENQKKLLEHLVQVRTAEVVAQKGLIEHQLEEISAQRDEIIHQRDEIEKQRDVATKQRDQIGLARKEIMDSIVYAKRIQRATLPDENFKSPYVKDLFIFFKPKDIVSGDFYWISERDNKLIIVAADCTGHGVPGAFMSMLGISFLNKIVNEEKITKPHLILNGLRQNVIKALHQSGADDEARDGMDLSMCTIDRINGVIEYSGANNPLYIISNKKDEVIKADKMPIAIFDVMDSFETHSFPLVEGDCYYIFSDGYADQFGGEDQKKFKYKPFREMLIEHSDKPMAEQKEILNTVFENWRGPHEQIDDVLVIGFRV